MNPIGLVRRILGLGAMGAIGLVRRILGLGAMGAIGLVGAKSWLDEGRANLRLDYERELSAFYADAAASACIGREAVIDTAMRQGWRVTEVPQTCPAMGLMRLVPDEPAPWRPGPDGFLIGFDGKGCWVDVPENCK